MGMTRPVPPQGWVAWLLIGVGAMYLLLMVALPLGNVFYQAFRSGWGAYVEGLTTAEARHAIGLTLLVVGVAVPVNTARYSGSTLASPSRALPPAYSGHRNAIRHILYKLVPCA